uniref:hypothetical protein n=1 Tax=Klebsiella pneumoniae TaxID=573 RepID=UPI001D0F1A64
AWEDVRDRRMFAHQLAARRGWYRDLLARRKALNAAILARCPAVAADVASRRGVRTGLRPGEDVRTT